MLQEVAVHIVIANSRLNTLATLGRIHGGHYRLNTREER